MAPGAPHQTRAALRGSAQVLDTPSWSLVKRGDGRPQSLLTGVRIRDGVDVSGVGVRSAPLEQKAWLSGRDLTLSTPRRTQRRGTEAAAGGGWPRATRREAAARAGRVWRGGIAICTVWGALKVRRREMVTNAPCANSDENCRCRRGQAPLRPRPRDPAPSPGLFPATRLPRGHLVSGAGGPLPPERTKDEDEDLEIILPRLLHSAPGRGGRRDVLSWQQGGRNWGGRGGLPVLCHLHISSVHREEAAPLPGSWRRGCPRQITA